MLKLSQLFIYPVKSMRGIQLSHTQVGESGLTFDRIFMLTEPNGQFVTARQYPALVCYTPHLIDNGVVISDPAGETIFVRFADFLSPMQPTEVWGNHFTSLVAPEEVNQWFSQRLKRPVQLRWLSEELTRRIRRFPEIPLSFADGYPFLLIGKSSFETLQQRCPSLLTITQFRPNLVIENAPPFTEDSWKILRIGEVIFDVVKPCARCILTTVNTESGKQHPLNEPLATLEQFRQAENGDIDFGQNLIARNQGIIRAGDQVEVLETQPAKSYITSKLVDNNPVSFYANSQESHNNVNIDFEGTLFIGNTQQVLLEQLEQQGIQVNYSCRAGICGQCKIRLIDGQVTALRKNAILSDGSLLSCSCIPKTHIRLTRS